MIYVDKGARVFLFYLFLLFFLDLKVIFLIVAVCCFTVFEDEEWFEEPGEYVTYGQGVDYDNDIDLLEAEFFRIRRKVRKKDFFKRFNNF